MARYYTTFGEFNKKAVQNSGIPHSQHGPVVRFWECGILVFSPRNAKPRVSGGADLAPSEPDRVYIGECNDYRDRREGSLTQRVEGGAA
jgi:hypothetical protein